MYGQEHLQNMLPTAEEIVGFIEQTVSQTRTDEDAEEAINEQRVEILVFDFLFLIQVFHDKESEAQSEQPAQRIPADGE